VVVVAMFLSSRKSANQQHTKLTRNIIKYGKALIHPFYRYKVQNQKYYPELKFVSESFMVRETFFTDLISKCKTVLKKVGSSVRSV